MKKSVTTTLALIATALLLASCASNTPMAPSQADSSAKTFKTNKHHANVYVYYDSFGGGGNNHPLIVDGKTVGAITSSVYAKVNLKSGTHTIKLAEIDGLKIQSDILRLNVKKNRNYFVKTGWTPGLIKKSNIKLALVNDATGKKAIGGRKLVQSQLNNISYANSHMKSKVKATSISTSRYKKYSCNQLYRGMLDLNSKIMEKDIKQQDVEKYAPLKGLMSAGTSIAINQSMSNSMRSPNLKNAGGNYNSATGTFKGSTSSYTPTSTPVFMPANTGAANKNVPADISGLLGQYNAMATVAKQKKCGFASKLK